MDYLPLFVDVRDPVEVMFVGFSDAVHINVPYLMVDRTAWDDKRGVYKLTQNANFVAQIKAALDKRLGRKVALASAYNLLHRHNWRKLAPDKRHPQSDPVAQQEWKKNSLKFSQKFAKTGRKTNPSS